jgi:hypothetical protein
MQVEAALFRVFCDGALLKTVARTTRNQVVRCNPTQPDATQPRLSLLPRACSLWTALVRSAPGTQAGDTGT